MNVSSAKAEKVQKTQKIQVEFNSPMSATNLISVVRKFDLAPTELSYVQGDMQGGYQIPEGEDIDTAVARLLEEHNKFLVQSIAQSSQAMKEEKDEASLKRLSVLNSQFVVALDKLNKKEFVINSIQTDSDEKVKKMIREGVAKEVTPNSSTQDSVTGLLGAQTESNLFSESFARTKSSTSRLRSYYHESWAPYRGSSNVTKFGAYNTFYFNNVSAFTFDSNSTLEIETQIYDAFWADYAGYYSSNLPANYYDTQFCDDSEPMVLTVGSAKASSIKSYTQYYTYMSLSPDYYGSIYPGHNTAQVRIKAQRGFRWPSWCYSTWCVYASETSSSLANFWAPSTVNWYY